LRGVCRLFRCAANRGTAGDERGWADSELAASRAKFDPALGPIAQWKSTRFTREGSLVRTQLGPPQRSVQKASRVLCPLLFVSNNFETSVTLSSSIVEPRAANLKRVAVTMHLEAKHCAEYRFVSFGGLIGPELLCAERKVVHSPSCGVRVSEAAPSSIPVTYCRAIADDGRAVRHCVRRRLFRGRGCRRRRPIWCGMRITALKMGVSARRSPSALSSWDARTRHGDALTG
jgi:hypothetical protein